MYANRGYGASYEDKKGENVAFKDNKNEESEAIRDKNEAGDGLDYASMEGNALSSDLTESNTDTAVHSKSGDQSSCPTKVNKFKNRNILFEIQLTPTNVEKGWFSIPVETALDFFPPLMTEASLQQSYYKKIKVSIPTPYYTWFMAITYDPEECLFLIKSREWQHFADWHGFKPTNIIRFYKPFPSAKSTHFLIEHFNVADEEGTSSTIVVPEFEEENFLFQKRLIPREMRNLSQRLLSLPEKKVKKHFSALRIPAPSHKMERLYFTDARNKEWCWKFMFGVRKYEVVDGWEGFVDEHKVDAGDAIRFYKFVESRELQPERHFLIQHVKKAKVQTTNPPTDADDAGTSTDLISGEPGKLAARKSDGAVGTSTNTASAQSGQIVRRNVGDAGTSTNPNAGQSGTIERNERNRGGESMGGRIEGNGRGGQGGSKRRGSSQRGRNQRGRGRSGGRKG